MELFDQKSRLDGSAASVGRHGKTPKVFFLETDMATETIVNRITRDKRVTIYNKMVHYDRYL